MPENIEGEIIFEPEFGSIVMRFTRTLPRPPRQVWNHLVDEKSLALAWETFDWDGGEVAWRLEPGSPVQRRAC